MRSITSFGGIRRVVFIVCSLNGVKQLPYLISLPTALVNQVCQKLRISCRDFQLLFILFSLSSASFTPHWGFYGHQKINGLAVFLLPPEMLGFYKRHIDYISEHAVDPDKRRYLVAAEGPRHFIDIDTYGTYPYPALPRHYDSAVAKFSEDSVQSHGIVPWWTVVMFQRLTKAFSDKDPQRILKLSAELGHYISDAHVPLHASHNHNGQFSNQKGIHGFWESRIPELLADKQFDFLMEKASYISDPAKFIWAAVLASAAASDTVLKVEKMLSASFPVDQKYAFENRNGKMVRQYSAAYSVAYDTKLKGMVERRMRQSIHATASFWYSAWINAGQPSLSKLEINAIPGNDTSTIRDLELQWKHAKLTEKSYEP